MESNTYYAQYGEDKILKEHLHNPPTQSGR
jgi:hypothetical protein